jgi:hypothetical protein
MRLKLVLVAVLLGSPLLFGQSAFDGTWHFKADSAQVTGNNDKVSLDNGTYRCDSCNPKIEAKADGHDHALQGSPYADTINVRAITDHEVEIVSKKDGKFVGRTKRTVSADGKTLTVEFENVINGEKANSQFTETRVGDVPSSMMVSSNSQSPNKITGEWKPDKLTAASENSMTYTYKMTVDTFSMQGPQASSYEAKLDGKDYPYKGDPGITSVSVKKIDANTVEETDKRDGKVIGVAHMTVDPDGKDLKLNYEDKLQGTTFSATAEKH